MVSIILSFVGGGLMAFGFFMLFAWVSGRSSWIDPSVLERSGDSKNDRMFIDLYYIAIVLAPLLSGSILLLYGVRQWLR